jgi:multimeric flavodoxin WrbA
MAAKKRKLVLGISGSPRRGGNTDAVVKEVLKGAKKAGARTQLVRVADLKISPCIACYYCASHHGVCAIKDDMQRVYGLLKKADAWVLGTPIYWFTMSAQLKAPVDRLFAFAMDECCQPAKGKAAAVVTTSGDPDTKEMASAVFDAFTKSFEFLGVRFAGRLALQGVAKKDVKKRWTNYRRAQKLGAKLAK